METPQNPLSFFQSNTARMLMVGFLTLLLLIPLFFVQDLIAERSTRQKEVIAETTGKWGKGVYFYGPILKVPYHTYAETVLVNQQTKAATTQKTAMVNYAYFFPETLQNDAAAETSVRNRANYESVVFTARMRFSGQYIRPDFSSIKVADTDILWDKATILIKTSNLESIKDEVKINLGNHTYTFEPVFSTEGDSVAALETDFIDASAFTSGKTVAFDFGMTYNGSKQIMMVPIGKTTQMRLRSNWTAPGFTGKFLPANPSKNSSDKGFVAHWKVLHLNRAFGQQFFDGLPALRKFAFGVDFVIPVNQYLQNERAAKYGFLVIGLTFLIFFLIQVISKIRIHIFQYTMIGLALVLFYTLLISITEHSSFQQAYAVASVSVVAMIGLYALSVLKSRKFAGFIACALAILYGFIFVIIQMENYALLFGSMGLFAILGAVMYFSRQIDWNK